MQLVLLRLKLRTSLFKKNKNHCFYKMNPGSFSGVYFILPLPPFPLHLKARALLRPLHRLHLSVSIHIRTQIPVSYHPCFRIIHLQCPYQHPQRMSLPLCTRIFGHSVAVQSTLVANSYATRIVTPCMRPGLLYGTKAFDVPVQANVIMIPRFADPPSQMIGSELRFRVVAVSTSGGTVNDD